MKKFSITFFALLSSLFSFCNEIADSLSHLCVILPDAVMHYPYVKTWTYDFEDHYGKHVCSTLNTYIEPTPTLDVLAVGEKTYLRHLEQIGDVTNTYYMRQEKECIYIYDDSQKAEHMLYDFGLSEGDEYVDPYDGVRYKVQEVSDTLMVSHEEWLNTSYQKYKVLRLCSTDGRDIQDTWIEGIGSVHYGLLRPGLHSEFIHQNLLTCDWGFESARHKFHYNLPYLKTTTVESYSLGYGKPEDDDYPKWLYGKDLEYEFLSDTLHVTGRSAVHGGHIDYAICTQNGGKLTVSLFESQSLIQGIGQVHVDAYFPGFAEGAYTVNGKELSCKGHTGVLGLIQIKHNVSEKSIFDLSGRRLQQKPQKGIYIENGKKIINK